MDSSGTTQPSLEAWQGVPDTDAAGRSGKGREGRSCECVCPGRYGPLPPQASPRRGAARRAADAAPDATRQYDGAFEGPANLARARAGRRRLPSRLRDGSDPEAGCARQPAGFTHACAVGSPQAGPLLLRSGVRALGSAWCRPATRRPRRRRPGPKRLSRTARDLISFSLALLASHTSFIVGS